ncbi:proprotein convertase P-domain-containing protein [Roseiconus sp. JC912]|uniref:proprotein convertase P-domain-containing protein n=2 Tax=Pirellulaceae TaxID=2691357 RepID=UPI003A4C5641
MNNVMRCAVVVALSAALHSVSFADIIDSSGSGFAIPDDSSPGFSSIISITQNEMISGIEVDLFGLTHEWAGDLIATLESPHGSTTSLFYRPGAGQYGDGSDFNGDYTFADSGADLETELASINGATAAASGVYFAATDNGNFTSLVSTFAGEATAGDWKLTISDHVSADTGSLGGWGLRITSTAITAIPEPSHASALCVAGLVFLRRRRR